MKIDDKHFDAISEAIIEKAYEEQPLLSPSTIADIVILMRRTHNESKIACSPCHPIDHINDFVNSVVYCCQCNSVIGPIPLLNLVSTIIEDDIDNH